MRWCLGAPTKSCPPPHALQGPIGLTGRAGPPVSGCDLGHHQGFWGPLPSRTGYMCSVTLLLHRVTQDSLGRKETLGGLVPQDPSAPEDET